MLVKFGFLIEYTAKAYLHWFSKVGQSYVIFLSKLVWLIMAQGSLPFAGAGRECKWAWVYVWICVGVGL